MEIAMLVPCYRLPSLKAVTTMIDTHVSDCQRLWPQTKLTVWLIDDGVDAQLATQIEQLKATSAQYHCLTLSRHFGYLAAVQAGLATITADAYLVIDALLPEMLASIPALVDALVVGGYDVVGFAHRRKALFHDCALTAVAKRALLQATAQADFSLKQLANIGFKQKRLRWHGDLPPQPPIPKAGILAAMGVLALLSWWPLTSMLLNIGLLGIVIWQWRPKRRVRYIVAKSD